MDIKDDGYRLERLVIRNYAMIVALGLAVMLVTGVSQDNTSESGLLEIWQLLVLVVSFISWVGLTTQLRKKSPANQCFSPVIASFIALLVFTILGRETSWLRIWDMRHLHVVWEINVKFVGIAIIALSLVYIARQWVWHVTDKRQVCVSFLKSSSSWLVMLSGGWLLLGQLCEKGFFALEQPQYYEELYELVAYFTLLYASWQPWVRVNR